MFEKLIEQRLVSAIGAKVVDDSQSITIPVVLPPEEGKADIIYVDKPSSFTPGVSFGIDISVKNIGEDDTIFARIKNSDTGEVLKESSATVGGGLTKLFTFNVVLVQKTAFHGLIEAGHVE